MDRLKDDFRAFLWHIWGHLRLPEPTPVQLEIAKYIQHAPKRAMVQAFRGVGKSWITAACVCWRLYCNPDEKILVVSASAVLANNFTTFVLQLINEVPLLQHLKPGSDQRNAKIQFDVGPAGPSKDPSVRSAGITGMITGSRATLIIADDIETPANSQTQLMREKLAEGIKEFDSVLLPGGSILFLGTPQTEASIYGLLPQRGFDLRVWPARYPDEKLYERYKECLAPGIVRALAADPALIGHTTEPRRFSDLDLTEREVSMGRSTFALQFLLDPAPSDANRYPLRLSDLIVMDLSPEAAPEQIIWAGSQDYMDKDLPNVGLGGDRLHKPMRVQGDFIPYDGSVMAIDPAGRGKDELGYSVVNRLANRLFLLACSGLSGGYATENLVVLAETAKRFKVNKVVVEANMGDGMFTELLKPVFAKIYPCTIEEVKHSVQKEKRIIDTLEPVMNQHKLIVDRSLVRSDYESTQHLPTEIGHYYQLFYQLTRVTREKGALRHDDRLDALAIGVAYWAELMAADIDEANQARAEAAREAQLRAFVEDVTDTALPSGDSWMATPDLSFRLHTETDPYGYG